MQAAHCCGSDWTDDHYIYSITHMKSGQEIELEQVLKHPDYVFDTLKNDICLIKEKFKKKISVGVMLIGPLLPLESSSRPYRILPNIRVPNIELCHRYCF